MTLPAVAPNFRIKLDGQPKPEVEADLQSFVVERDVLQPDMATFVLSNQGGEYSLWKIGSEIELFVGDDDGMSVFKGEVTGLEPIYRGGEQARIVVRAMNRLHRLLRKRKSRTFSNKSDVDILNEIATDAGMQVEALRSSGSSSRVVHKHVYQHNQTDLEFLRTRAARLGWHLWCVDKTIYYGPPDLEQQPSVNLTTTGAASGAGGVGAVVKSFTPRLSSASVVKKVTVKGWDPERKELLVGTYQSESSRLGAESAVKAVGELAADETFTVDHPIWSKEEADALARARFVDLALTFITGECEITLDPARTLGEVVSITANEEPDTADEDPFNGRYYVMGVTHRFGKKETGYTTVLRVARDAQKKDGGT